VTSLRTGRCANAQSTVIDGVRRSTGLKSVALFDIDIVVGRERAFKLVDIKLASPFPSNRLGQLNGGQLLPRPPAEGQLQWAVDSFDENRLSEDTVDHVMDVHRQTCVLIALIYVRHQVGSNCHVVCRGVTLLPD
jgi:hypothetical protein